MRFGPFDIQLRTPDFTIWRESVALIRRWYLKRRKEQGLNIYLHHMLAGDPDRDLHDHRSWNISIVLKGRYIEHCEDGSLKVRTTGQVIFRRATALHRIELPVDNTGFPIPCWTIFILGPWYRNWGFMTTHGWVPHETYLPVEER